MIKFWIVCTNDDLRCYCPGKDVFPILFESEHEAAGYIREFGISDHKALPILEDDAKGAIIASSQNGYVVCNRYGKILRRWINETQEALPL